MKRQLMTAIALMLLMPLGFSQNGKYMVMEREIHGHGPGQGHKELCVETVEQFQGFVHQRPFEQSCDRYDHQAGDT